MQKLFITLCCLFAFALSPSAHAENDNFKGIQAFIDGGNPVKASATARLLLANTRLSEAERKSLLEIIAKAEVMITTARHFEDVKPAVKAIETLINEFPQQVDEEKLLRDIADLYWNQDSFEEAQAVILDLQSRYPDNYDSLMMLGKILYFHKNYAEARNTFLRYAIHVQRDSMQGLEVRMWNALVDYAEARFNQAYIALREVFEQQSAMISSEESIYARYIILLAMQQQPQEALNHAESFLAEYKTTKHAAEIRLLQNDLLLELYPEKAISIEKTYEILSVHQANTVIGRQAFMRKMVLHVRNETEYRNIKPVIIALKRIANNNQLSDIEDEAFLHEATMWEKVAQSDPVNAPAVAPETALTQFSRASNSPHQTIAQKAKKLGNIAFLRQIEAHIKNQDWLRAITLWQRFANFRPDPKTSARLRFDVAHGLRILMEFDQADLLLQQLHTQADGSVWGEKIMLERARLWLNRHDESGVSKVLSWLDKHEYTLYRPEMLVIVAQMQLKADHAIQAIHTLEAVMPDDISPESRAEYWRVQAQASEQLKRWHVAAKSWRTLSTLNIPDQDQAKLNEAHALFQGNDFGPAEVIYADTPEILRTSVWHYRYSICQLKTGQWNQAMARLEKLKADQNAGIYQSLATLTLAEREAERLLEKAP